MGDFDNEDEDTTELIQYIEYDVAANVPWLYEMRINGYCDECICYWECRLDKTYSLSLKCRDHYLKRRKGSIIIISSKKYNDLHYKG